MLLHGFLHALMSNVRHQVTQNVHLDIKCVTARCKYGASFRLASMCLCYGASAVPAVPSFGSVHLPSQARQLVHCL